MFRFTFALAAIAFCVTFALPATAAKTNDPAAAFVQSMGNKALTSLTAKELSGPVRAQRVRSLLRENFDIKTIGRFVMGPAWRDATEAQKAQYLDLFEDMIVKTYSRRFSDYSGQSFEVTGANKISDKDSMVKSRITQKDGAPVLVNWQVRNKGGSMKVVDVLVEEISMSVTQRSDFAAVIQSGGIDGLIKTLKERTGNK